MRIMIYAGIAPASESVLQYCAPIVGHVATALTLVTSGGAASRSAFDQALSLLKPPAALSITYRIFADDAPTAILTAAREQSYDLAIFGRLARPQRGLVPSAGSNVIAQRIEPSVLRVHGATRPIRRILLASGGDYHTHDDAEMAARLAGPLGAEITVLHVVAPTSLGGGGRAAAARFLTGPSSEARILREIQQLLVQRGIKTRLSCRVGTVLDEILAELRVGGYDLMVAGTHHAGSTLDRVLLDDITGELLDISPLPMLVVKNARSLPPS